MNICTQENLYQQILASKEILEKLRNIGPLPTIQYNAFVFKKCNFIHVFNFLNLKKLNFLTRPNTNTCTGMFI